jgi:serine/threonine protein kinase
MKLTKFCFFHLKAKTQETSDIEKSMAESIEEKQKRKRLSQIKFEELTIEKEIGEGAYGRVCLGKWNSAVVALKFCKKKGKIEEFLKEVDLMMYVGGDFFNFSFSLHPQMKK